MTDAVSLITAKRDGHRLADAGIRWLFDAYAATSRAASSRPRSSR